MARWERREYSKESGFEQNILRSYSKAKSSTGGPPARYQSGFWIPIHIAQRSTISTSHVSSSSTIIPNDEGSSGRKRRVLACSER